MRVLYVHLDKKAYDDAVNKVKEHVDSIIKEGYISEESRAITIFNWRTKVEDFITKFEGVVKDETTDGYLVDNLKGTVKFCNKTECSIVGI